MSPNSFRKFILPPGPILVLTLIGLMVFSALLYYKAVNAQRFLEPTLALSQPMIDFSQNTKKLLDEEFDLNSIDGLQYTVSSIFVNELLIFADPRHGEKSGSIFLTKLGKIFLSILENPDMSSRFDLILIITRTPYELQSGQLKKKRIETQQKALFILNSLYNSEPKLKKDYGKYFAATSILVSPKEEPINWIEFRFITSEHLHIEMIRSLGRHLR